jgi:hypothetical protein
VCFHWTLSYTYIFMSIYIYFKNCERFKSSAWSRLFEVGTSKGVGERSDDEWHNTVIGPIRGMNLKSLIENQHHTTVWHWTQRIVSSLSSNNNCVGFVSWKETSYSRGNNLLLRKAVLDSLNRHKNEIILVPIVITENEFLIGKKYLSMKGVWSVENRLLENVGMSLPSV